MFNDLEIHAQKQNHRQPGEEMREFLCPGLVADQEEKVTSEMIASKSLPLFFYPQGLRGEACLDVMAELATAPELDIKLVALSTDSLEVHRVTAVSDSRFTN